MRLDADDAAAWAAPRADWSANCHGFDDGIDWCRDPATWAAMSVDLGVAERESQSGLDMVSRRGRQAAELHPIENQPDVVGR